MLELLPLTTALASGALLGALFFGGLWWTVARAVSSPRPALWLFGSKLARTALVLGGFYLVGGGQLERWLLCLFGFVLARLVTFALTHRPSRNGLTRTFGAVHAP